MNGVNVAIKDELTDKQEFSLVKNIDTRAKVEGVDRGGAMDTKGNMAKKAAVDIGIEEDIKVEPKEPKSPFNLAKGGKPFSLSSEWKNSPLDFLAKAIVCATIVLLAWSIFNCIRGTSKDASMGKGVASKMGTAGATKTKKSSTVTVAAIKASYTNIESLVKVGGEVSAKSEVSIYPDTGGKVTRLLKDIGDSVTRGQIIAYVDPSKPGMSYIASPVISTVTGTIVAAPIKQGETVSSTTAIVKVGSLDRLKVTVNIAEKYSIFLKPGLKGYVTISSLPDTVFNATVYEVSPVVDPTRRSVEVSLAFDAKDDRIKSGMFVTLRLAVQSHNNTIVVPKSALKTYNAKDVVYIALKGSAHRVEVLKGLSSDTSVEILKGVEEGDMVITAGTVTEGAAVQIARESSGDKEAMDGGGEASPSRGAGNSSSTKGGVE